jgi:RNA polymerase sigma-70 factor (ECF subfamily)
LVFVQEISSNRVKLIEDHRNDFAMSSTLDDSALASAAASDPQAFAALYDRYVRRIYAYALHQTGDVHLAQDVTSATFEKALRHLRCKGWRTGSFLAWLYRIARNEAVFQYRKNRRLVDMPDPLSDLEGQTPVTETSQVDLQLRQAFSLLSAPDQEVLSLRFLDGLSSAETAEVLGCPLPKLYLQVHRALQRLRKVLETALADENARD